MPPLRPCRPRPRGRRGTFARRDTVALLTSMWLLELLARQPRRGRRSRLRRDFLCWRGRDSHLSRGGRRLATRSYSELAQDRRDVVDRRLLRDEEGASDL